jgi:transposase
VRPVVTRVERYAGHCPCCGGVTVAPVPAGMEDGSPFSVNVVVLALHLRFTDAISYRRLTQLFLHLHARQISEGALDAMLQRAKPCFDNEVEAILAQLCRWRIVCSDETSARIDGRTHWNGVFQNDQVVIHVVQNSRAANVVTETMAGHRPSIWVSDLYGAQQGHADLWQVCLAHQLRDCQYAIEAGDAIFAPQMKALLLRAVVLARRRKQLVDSTRRTHQALIFAHQPASYMSPFPSCLLPMANIIAGPKPLAGAISGWQRVGLTEVAECDGDVIGALQTASEGLRLRFTVGFAPMHEPAQRDWCCG